MPPTPYSGTAEIRLEMLRAAGTWYFMYPNVPVVETEMSLSTDDYDSEAIYYFEIVAGNYKDIDTNYVELIDEDGNLYVSINVPQSDSWVLQRVEFTPKSGSTKYYVRYNCPIEIYDRDWLTTEPDLGLYDCGLYVDTAAIVVGNYGSKASQLIPLIGTDGEGFGGRIWSPGTWFPPYGLDIPQWSSRLRFFSDDNYTARWEISADEEYPNIPEALSDAFITIFKYKTSEWRNLSEVSLNVLAGNYPSANRGEGYSEDNYYHAGYFWDGRAVERLTLYWTDQHSYNGILTELEEARVVAPNYDPYDFDITIISAPPWDGHPKLYFIGIIFSDSTDEHLIPYLQYNSNVAFGSRWAGTINGGTRDCWKIYNEIDSSITRIWQELSYSQYDTYFCLWNRTEDTMVDGSEIFYPGTPTMGPGYATPISWQTITISPSALKDSCEYELRVRQPDYGEYEGYTWSVLTDAYLRMTVNPITSMAIYNRVCRNSQYTWYGEDCRHLISKSANFYFQATGILVPGEIADPTALYADIIDCGETDTGTDGAEEESARVYWTEEDQALGKILKESPTFTLSSGDRIIGYMIEGGSMHFINNGFIVESSVPVAVRSDYWPMLIRMMAFQQKAIKQ